MSAPSSRIRVALDIGGTAVDAGHAYVTERRGVVSTVFDYDRRYLAEQRSYALSPDLPLADGRHTLLSLPGCFADSAPDRWGRDLVAKRIRSESRAEGTPRTIREIDYLLGVSDATRQGALRFALDDDGPFLAVEPGVPKMVELPRLLRAADAAGSGGADDLAAVKELLDAGSASLGGARPKASVQDGAGLLMAKFPHGADEWDVMAWEKTALDLAELCDIRVPKRELARIDGRSVLVLQRFDRLQTGRVGYISAMTLLRARDGDRADYLEIAEAIGEHGSDVEGDLAELWRRVALSLVINNVDDHLRNHGFLREKAGWRLSPAFDINPHPDVAAERVTSVGFVSDAAAARDALFASAGEFGLTSSDARSLWEQVLTATAGWREVATSNGISDSSCDLFAPALDRHRGQAA